MSSSSKKSIVRTYYRSTADHITVDHYLQKLEKSQKKEEYQEAGLFKIPPTICFSRNIGVGAVEIADILAKNIKYRVVERQILEHIAKELSLAQNSDTDIANRYVANLSPYISRLFKENNYNESVYNKNLFATILSLSQLESTIFVGWGAHLILPRERVLAVRFIGSKEYRTKRLSDILHNDESEINEKLNHADEKQLFFFKSVFNHTYVAPDSFDLVINCHFMQDPKWCADIVHQAFKSKFKL